MEQDATDTSSSLRPEGNSHMRRQQAWQIGLDCAAANAVES